MRSCAVLQEACLLEWRSIVGTENVVTDQAALDAAAASTFFTTQRLTAIVSPANREQVQACLRAATRHHTPVYPISSGRNWGYGSRVPAADGCALLNLGRMNRIVDFSEELAYVTVEPGVTQGQLIEFLASRGSRLWADVSGSSAACSLIGNAMERGFGHTPYGDHASKVCGFEVVLPNGEVIDTGSARFAGSAAGPIYRWGVGPSLDGLFLQSNLGVVTRMTFWLMPAPEYFQAFFFRCDRQDGLPALIDALRPLQLNNTLRSAIHIGNDYKVLSGIRQYPWEDDSATPLTPERMVLYRKKLNFGVWNGGGGLYGTRAQVAEGRRALRKALAGKVDRIQFLDDRRFGLATRFAGPAGLVMRWDISKALELARPLYGLMKGIPTDETLGSVYWRKRTPPPEQMDPDRDRCGLMWCGPVAPAAGHHAEKLAALASRILLRHGFEPQLSITLITERALICVISISYDRDVPGEDAHAQECFDELKAELARAGYPPYRLGVQNMDQMMAEGAYAQILRSLKQAVDPAGILAPGRYEPAPVLEGSV